MSKFYLIEAKCHNGTPPTTFLSNLTPAMLPLKKQLKTFKMALEILQRCFSKHYPCKTGGRRGRNPEFQKTLCEVKLNLVSGHTHKVQYEKQIWEDWDFIRLPYLSSLISHRAQRECCTVNLARSWPTFSMKGWMVFLGLASCLVSIVTTQLCRGQEYPLAIHSIKGDGLVRTKFDLWTLK